MFYIYGKGPENKKFLPISGGDFVTKKIHAEIFTTRESAETVLASVQSLNPEFQFEIRGF